MFRVRVLFIFSILAGAFVLLWERLRYSTEEQKQALDTLITKSATESASGQLEQTRYFLRRDLVGASSSSMRSASTLYCQSACLSIDWNNKDAIEKMTGLRGYREEGPSALYYFLADEGCYCHASGELTAYPLTLQRVQLPQQKEPVILEKAGCTAIKIPLREVPFSFTAQEFWVESLPQKARAQSQSAYYDGTSLHLEGDVQVDFSEGAQLCAERGRCSFSKGEAFFFSDKRPVSAFFPTDGKREEMCLLAHSLQLLFTQEDKGLFIQDVRAQGDAALYSEEGKWSISGASIHYKELPGRMPRQGMLELEGKQDVACLLTKEGMGHLQASFIEIDVESQRMQAKEAQGKIQASAGAWAGFQAHCMLADHKERFVDLQEEVSVWQEDMGRLQTDERLFLCYDEQNTVTSLEASGRVTIEGEGGLQRKVNCPGRCQLDLARCTALFASDGSSQVSFQEGGINLCSDSLRLDYQVAGSNWQATCVEADGRVLLKNHYASSMGASATQYALADRLSAKPQERSLHLFSKSPARVLLLDNGNGLAISAPQVVVEPDGLSGKERVRGVGDVRLTLLEKEYQLLKQRFHFKKPQVRKKNT